MFRLSNAQILTVAQRCNGLQSLNISHISGVDDALVDGLASALWIEELDLSYCAQVTDGPGLLAGSVCVCICMCVGLFVCVCVGGYDWLCL